jgi:cell division protein FtsZ
MATTAELQSRLFDVPGDVTSPGLCIVAVGGPGCRSVSGLRSQLRTRPGSGVGVFCLDDDAASLARTGADDTMLLRPGLLWEADGWAAVTEADYQLRSSLEPLRRCMADAECVVVVAGAGDPSGATVAPVVAQLARDSGALVIGAHLRAADTFDRLRAVADAVFEAPGSGQADGRSTISQVTSRDRRYVASLAAMFRAVVTAGGDRLALTVSHLRSTLQGGAIATFGTGEGAGKPGATQAAERCVEAVLANRTSAGVIDRASILVEAGPGLSVSQVASAVSVIESRLGPEVEVQVGVRRSRLRSESFLISVVGTVRAVVRPLAMTQSAVDPAQLVI